MEVDERVSIVGFEVDPEGNERAVKFNEDGKVERRYKVKGVKEEDIDYEGDGPGEVVIHGREEGQLMGLNTSWSEFLECPLCVFKSLSSNTIFVHPFVGRVHLCTPG